MAGEKPCCVSIVHTEEIVTLQLSCIFIHVQFVLGKGTGLGAMETELLLAGVGTARIRAVQAFPVPWAPTRVPHSSPSQTSYWLLGTGLKLPTCFTKGLLHITGVTWWVLHSSTKS